MNSQVYPRPSAPRPLRRAGWALWLAGALTACASGPKPPPAAPEPPPAVVEQLGGGGVVVIQRPTPKWVRLSLWLSVGAQHGRSPALATLAARWAAQQAGAEARVLPDATEIHLDCDLEQERLPRCVRRLASSLAAPPPSAKEVGALVRRLRRDRSRREARAHARLDLEALTALLGADAVRGWDPLAEAAGDRPNAAAVGAFLRDHYGPDRALLVAAGDVTEKDVADWAQGLEPARVRRPPARIPPPDATAEAVRVVAGSRTALVLALAAPSLERATALGHAFTLPHPGTGASAFVVDGQALLLLRVPVVGGPWGELRTAVFDALRLSLEGTSDVPPRAPAQDLASLCRRTGEAWVHGGHERSVPQPWPLGVALAMRSAEPVAPSHEAKADEQRAEAQARAEEVAAAARAQLHPHSRGRADEARAELTLDNGLHIEIERRAHDATFAASVEVQGGAALDGAGRHGRAAHLATLAASACGFASRPALAEGLRREGTRMGPMVSAEKWGVVTHGPAEHWREGVDRLLRCVVRPSFRARDVEDARLALLSELSDTPGAEHAWGAARTLLPEAPGVLAPWGSPEGVAAVDMGSLRTLHVQSLRAGGMRVRLRVPAPAEQAAQFVARRLAQLPAGSAPEPPPPQPPAPRALEGVQREDTATVRAWIGVIAAQPLEGDAAAVTVAEQVGYRLDALPGYALRGVAAGGSPFAWLWLELMVTDPTRLDALPAAVDAAMRATRRSVPDVVEPALARAERERRSAASDPARELRKLFSSSPAEAATTRGLRGLLDAEPSFVLAYPLEE